jgi:hypothetical protein
MSLDNMGGCDLMLGRTIAEPDVSLTEPDLRSG